MLISFFYIVRTFPTFICFATLAFDWTHHRNLITHLFNDCLLCFGSLATWPMLFVQCNAGCGSQGTKYRTVRCVWYGTSRQAQNGCRNMTRPAVMKECKGPPCAENCKSLPLKFENDSPIFLSFWLFFYFFITFVIFFGFVSFLLIYDLWSKWSSLQRFFEILYECPIDGPV